MSQWVFKKTRLLQTQNSNTCQKYCCLAYQESKTLQLQLQPTRTQAERRVQPDSSDEEQLTLCLGDKNITNIKVLTSSDTFCKGCAFVKTLLTENNQFGLQRL